LTYRGKQCKINEDYNYFKVLVHEIEKGSSVLCSQFVCNVSVAKVTQPTD